MIRIPRNGKHFFSNIYADIKNNIILHFRGFSSPILFTKYGYELIKKANHLYFHQKEKIVNNCRESQGNTSKFFQYDDVFVYTVRGHIFYLINSNNKQEQRNIYKLNKIRKIHHNNCYLLIKQLPVIT